MTPRSKIGYDRGRASAETESLWPHLSCTISFLFFFFLNPRRHSNNQMDRILMILFFLILLSKWVLWEVVGGEMRTRAAEKVKKITIRSRE
jgi:hypothetical protein